MSIDLDALEKLARAATSGPWKKWTTDDSPSVAYFENGVAFHVARCTGWDNQQMDAAYIAAVSPDVVLELIAEVERLRAQPCPHVVTHGTTSHCTLAESSALRQPVSPSMEPSP